MREFCGIAGIYSKKKKNITGDLIKALFALQHRGQEGAGIALWGKHGFTTYKNFGLINEVFTEDVVTALDGYVGIAHTRYSTEGESRNVYNIQPLTATFKEKHVAVAHNGTLSNFREIKKELEEKGMHFFSSSDSEIILAFFIQSFDKPYEERLLSLAQKVKGAFSILIQEDDTIIAFRDPWGFRPLVWGENEEYIVFSSETVSLVLLDINHWEEVKPGEAIIIKNGEIEKKQIIKSKSLEYCVFELIYFSRPDSMTFGHDVYSFRKLTGKLLARKEDREIDIVVPVPESGVPAALGYAEELNKPLEFALMRSYYVGRSFIEPSDRENTVKMKLWPIKEVLEGKRIALIDDSLVRGTTSKEIIKLLRRNGAKEVHFRLASPPITSPCFFGIDIPTREELLASSRTVTEITREIGTDSVKYLSIDDLKQAIGEDFNSFCYACFTGEYNPSTLPPEKYKELSSFQPPILKELKIKKLF